jgi:hypothetical protein
MMKKLVFLLAIFVFIGSTQAQKLIVGPQLGYFVPAEKDADGSVYLGGAARLKFGSLGVEGAINYRQQSKETIVGKFTTKFYPVMVSGLIYPIPMVYATAGIGWYNYTVELEFLGHTSDYSDSEIGYHIGGGVELPVGNMILSGDIKYIFMEYQFEDSDTDFSADGFVINATLFFKLN